MYQLHGSDFYLSLTLGDELHASNIVWLFVCLFVFFIFFAMKFHFPSRLLFVGQKR